MIALVIIFYIVGLLLLVIGVAVYKGKTGLIHYHQRKNVVDHIGFGRAMGRPCAIMGISGIICATMSLFGELWMTVGIIVFFVSIIAMIIVSMTVTKKYNGTIF